MAAMQFWDLLQQRGDQVRGQEGQAPVMWLQIAMQPYSHGGVRRIRLRTCPLGYLGTRGPPMFGNLGTRETRRAIQERSVADAIGRDVSSLSLIHI